MSQLQRVDLIASLRNYVDKIATDKDIGGMKALLLDPTTTKIVSMVYSQTQILEQEVYLVAQLGKELEPMHHLKAAVFIQPTEKNLAKIIKELREPKFAEYHLFFSNVVSQDMLTRLARADEHDMIKQVQEYFADFPVVNEDFFHLGSFNSVSLSGSMSRTVEADEIFERNVNGVLALLLAVKRKPAQIRHQATSEIARRVATSIVTKIERDDVFEFRTPGPVLLILDRRDDPITPLLTQWTYQAMVHELLGLNWNRVDLSTAPNIKDDMKEVVLSCTQDEFFARNRYANFGDLGSAVKGLLDDYQRDSKLNEKISSIEDMQNFMERYPKFRSRSLNVTKHVAVMGELSRLTDRHQLLDISELEQVMACDSAHSEHKQSLLEKISSRNIQAADKLRLAIIFLLRYESFDEIREVKAALAANGVAGEKLRLIDEVIEYAGEARRAPGLFSAGGSILTTLKRGLGVVEGVDNVYTQHQPLLSNTLDAFSKGKLKDSVFPVLSSTGSSSRISEMIVFIVGGATFEEATKVAEFNATNPGFRVILGGSCVHNSKSFLDEVHNTFER